MIQSAPAEPMAPAIAFKNYDYAQICALISAAGDDVTGILGDDISSALPQNQPGQSDPGLSKPGLSKPGQPEPGKLGTALGLDPQEARNLLRRWAGLQDVPFRGSGRDDHTPRTARDPASGLGGSAQNEQMIPGHLGNLDVHVMPMAPAYSQNGGRGLDIRYGYYPSPFGDALIMRTEQGICGLGFADDATGHATLFAELQQRWPNAEYTADQGEAAALIEQVFVGYNRQGIARDRLKLTLTGTAFDIRVWTQLLTIPSAQTVTYGALAQRLNLQGGARAVGGAIGRNPIAFLVPCHRVIRANGTLGGYRWDPLRKHVMLTWESLRGGVSSP